MRRGDAIGSHDDTANLGPYLAAHVRLAGSWRPCVEREEPVERREEVPRADLDEPGAGYPIGEPRQVGEMVGAVRLAW